MSKKSFILGLGLWLAALLGGCQSTTVPDPEPNPGPVEPTNTPIRLGVSELASSSRAGGTVLTTIDQIVGEQIAVYGVCELFGSATRLWAEADRLINTTTAQAELDPVLNDYKLNYASTTAYYPAGGYLNVYALYPANVPSYVSVIDDKTQAPQAQVTLADRFHKQYDVLYGKTEQLTVAQAQQARVTFEHALAQLQIKIYRDPEVSAHPTLTKIVVRGVSKATLASIERPNFTNSTLPADSLDFIAFQGSMPLTATTKETALVLNADSALMLLPGLASINRIEATVDGNTFVTLVPNTWDLQQGKTNTLTLTLRKMDLRLETPWVVTPWQTGQGVDQEIENNGKLIRISGTMLDASTFNKTTYAGVAPASADISLLGFTRRGVAIESVTGGVFTTTLFNCGILNDNPLYLEGLTLYDASGKVLFAGQLNNDGKFASGGRIYIDEHNKGLLKKDTPLGAAIGLSLTFGGFGDGTVALPYEVHSPFLLGNIDKLLGSNSANGTNALNGTNGGGAKFIQTADINLLGSSFFGLAQQTGTFYGIYDGQNHKIKNVNLHSNGVSSQSVGLFGKASLSNFISTLITRVVIEGGSVRNTNTGTATGALVGALSGGAMVSHCSNSATVTGLSLNVGGLVGQIASTSSLTHSANFGAVSSNSGALGGLIGRSSSSAAFVMTNCYNAGSVTYTGSVIGAQVGGGIGYLVMGSATPTMGNCYNRGTVAHPNALNVATTGSLVGYATGSVGLSAGSTNSYWLTGSYTLGVGTNAMNVASKVVAQSTAELQALAPTLGSSWKADYTTNPINEGFPILMWQ